MIYLIPTDNFESASPCSQGYNEAILPGEPNMKRAQSFFLWIRNLMQHVSFPVAAILFMELAGLSAVMVLQVFRGSSINFTNKMGLGYDYEHFLLGARAILSGNSPYIVGHYVTPPVPAILNIPFAFLLDDRHAIYIVFLLIPCCVLLALWWIHRAVNGALAESEKISVFLLAAGAMAFGYPFLFLLDRENIDGFVLLAACAGVCLLQKRPCLAGISLALAVSLKLYPILLVFPLLARRQWKTLLWLGIGLLALFLVAPSLWIEFFSQRLFARTTEFQAYDNISLTALFFHIPLWSTGAQVQVGNVLSAGWMAGGAFLLILAAMILLDVRMPRAVPAEIETASIILYFPLMIAIPQTAYQYEGILLIALLPVLCFAWMRTRDKVSRALLLGIALGISLTQLLTVPLNRLLGEGRFDMIASFGLLVILLASVGYKFRLSRLPMIFENEKTLLPNPPLGHRESRS
jgi:hypothetical protein